MRPLISVPPKLGRPPRHDRRLVLNAIFYVVRSGCAWRLLPHDLPPWRLGYYYFAKWRESGLWQEINDHLRAAVREKCAKKKTPVLRSSTRRVLRWLITPGVRGYDAGKKIRGRKRHLVVDTLGLILGIVVTAAEVSDRAGALAVLPPVLRTQPRLEQLWADAGYEGGTLAAQLRAHAAHPALRLDIIKRSDPAPKGFQIPPKRWIVERTFGWLMQARRLARDDETKPASSEAMILAQASKIMLRRLAK